MEELVKDIYRVQVELDTLNSKITNLESQKTELLNLFITEACTTDKKLDFPMPDGRSLKVYARDYKKFTDEVDMELERAKKEYEASIKPQKKEFESTTAEIKRVAEREGKQIIDRKWYAKVE